MRNRFDQQLELLNEQLIRMGELCEVAIGKATTALEEGSMEQAQKVIEADEEIDQAETDIERLCLKLLLQQQPVARDLRQISAALKMITDMERIGDHAADISEMTVWIHGENYVTHLNLLEEMAKAVTVMLVGSIDAFVCKNLKQAEEVIAKDDIVDDLFLKVKEEVIQMLRESDGSGEEAADLLLIAKYFERIGDHATNISEWVIYSITGKHVS